MKRKIILNIAMSLDGYIAEDSGNLNWLVGDGDKSNNTKEQFSFPDFINNIDTIVMGKKSYEDAPAGTFEMFKSTKIYVASSEKLKTKHDNIEYNNIEFISGDIVSQILKIKKEEGKAIWLMGGAVIIDYFIKADVIDEYVIGIIPIILGSGTPLFLEKNPKLELHLDGYTMEKGVAMLRYSKRK